MCLRLQPSRSLQLGAAALMQQSKAVGFESTTGSRKTIDELYAGLDSKDYSKPESGPVLAPLVTV